MTRTIFAILLLCALAPFGVVGQSTQPAATTALDANAQQLLLDVVVTDNGEHIHGLDRSRFHVFDDGRELTLTSFEEHKPPAASSTPVALPQLPPNFYSNLPQYAPSDTINVVLLDILNTPVHNQQLLRHRLVEFLDNLPPGRTIAVFALTSKLEQIQGLTNNPSALKEAITALKNVDMRGKHGDSNADKLGANDTRTINPVVTNALTDFWSNQYNYGVGNRFNMTFDAMKRLTKFLALLPGRKNLIWLSGSFPVRVDANIDSNPAAPSQSDTRDLDSLMCKARISFYPVDIYWQMTEASFSANGNLDRSLDLSNKNMTVQASLIPPETWIQSGTSIDDLAEQTGGIAARMPRDLAKPLDDAIEHGDSYYTLGFTPSDTGKKGVYHKLKVVLDGSYGKLAYWRAYYAKSGITTNVDRTNVAAIDRMNVAAIPGAPQLTDLHLLARVLPADDPLFKGAKFPPGPAGDGIANSKAPLTRYVIDLKVDSGKLTFSEPQPGVHHAELELLIVAYDAAGNRVNFFDHSAKLDYDDAKFKVIVDNGIHTSVPFDLPAGTVTLRIVAADKLSGKLGTLEVPLTVKAK